MFLLAASDCFELGRQSYHNRDYYHTVLWMQEAMDRLQEEQNATTTSKPDILEYLAFSTYMQGMIYVYIYIYDTFTREYVSNNSRVSMKKFIQKTVL